MITIEMLIVAVGTLAVVSLIEFILICKLFINAREDRDMLCLLLKDSLKAKMVEMKKGLEDLMNIKTDVKKTNTKRKTK